MPLKNPNNKRLIERLTPIFIKLVIWLVGLTCRKKWFGLEHIQNLQKTGQNWVYSIWHENITCAALLLKNQELVSLVSTSQDGAFAADILDGWGYQIVRGSTTKGGSRALIKIIGELKTGKNGAITPDGPRGPRHQLQNGVVFIGSKAGAPLVPFHIEASRQWIFNSWDKHKFPKPFSTWYISIGEPYRTPENTDKKSLEDSRKKFENLMLQNVERAKNLVKGENGNNEL